MHKPLMRMAALQQMNIQGIIFLLPDVMLDRNTVSRPVGSIDMLHHRLAGLYISDQISSGDGEHPCIAASTDEIHSVVKSLLTLDITESELASNHRIYNWNVQVHGTSHPDGDIDSFDQTTKKLSLFSAYRNFLRLIACLTIPSLFFLHPLFARDPDLHYLTIRQPVSYDKNREILAEVIRGNRELLERSFPPASLFKVVIARSALRHDAIRPGESYAVERDFPGKKRDLHDILFYSSNHAFLLVARRIGKEKLKSDAMQSGMLNLPLPADFADPSSSAIFRGDGATTTPRRVHAYFLALSESTEMDEFLRWPGRCAAAQSSEGSSFPEAGKISAKSGTWGGAAWMAGYCRDGHSVTVVTVLVPYSVPRWRPARQQAIGLFYKELGAVPPAALEPGARSP